MSRNTKTSTAQKRKRSTASRGQRARLNQIIYIASIVLILVLGGYYLLTGSDPLGLFTQPEDQPAVVGPDEPVTGSIGSTGSGGDWWQVYFTVPQTINDPDNLTNSIPEKLIDYIDNAQHMIHIAAFEFNLTPVAEALIAAHKRGVEVEWVTDDEYGIAADEEEEDHGQFAMLKEAGIEVKDDGREALMHNKFWIFDDQTVWTGSTNVTVNDNFRNNNNVIVIDSPELARIYEREFAEMWNGEFGPTSPSTADAQTTTINGTPVEVLFAAEDGVATQLVSLIESAQNSIRFMAFSFTHDEMGEAVLARAKRGVDVQGIFEARGSETEYSELTTLYCAGVPVRQDGNPRIFHHKVFIIDGQMVVTGSFNFTSNADESNDENVIIVSNRDIAAQYLQEFQRRWTEATEPSKADIKCD